MADEPVRVDVSTLSDEEIGKLKNSVLKRLVDGHKKARLVTSNLSDTHSRHSSIHSKG